MDSLLEGEGALGKSVEVWCLYEVIVLLKEWAIGEFPVTMCMLSSVVRGITPRRPRKRGEKRGDWVKGGRQ